jgi:Asp/Glu/hydantoin racemase
VSDPIIVINPNSTEAVTEGMRLAVAALVPAGGPPVECVTLTEGPPGIESQADADTVVVPLLRYVETRNAEASAFVIACYSDPGLHAAREIANGPVFGIAECGLMTALTWGARIGVISILARSVPRHMRYARSLGIAARIAADLPIELGVRELADEGRVLARLVEVGGTLVEEHGADVLVLGCAGMARYQRLLEDALRVPVIEPTRAAVAIALGATAY